VGLVASLFRANSPAWNDERFWHHIGHDTSSGVRVSPTSALAATAVYDCVRIRAETVASIPLIVYKRLPNGDKERAPYHPLYKVLHDQPNNWQTAFEWREMMQAHLDLRGNAYSRKMPGPDGPISQLIPLHPDRVTATLYTDNSIDYTVRGLDGSMEKLAAEEILHLRGWSEDGVHGITPISAQRDVIGIALGAQDYSARFLKNDVSPSLVYKHPEVLDKEAYERIKDDVQNQNTGENRHKAMILEDGLSIEKLGMTNRDAQLIESQKYTDGKIASIYRVPPHMIGLMDRATHSNIEHQGIEFTVYTMLPIAKRWEGIIARDLFFPLYDDGGEYFAEFLLDGLNRGDMDSRYTAYAIGRNWGWLSANDVRRLENMNSIGDQGDEYLRPLNMTIEGAPQAKQIGVGSPANDDESSEPPPPDDGSEEENQASATRMRLFALAESAASRLVRKETSALSALVKKHSDAARTIFAALEAGSVDIRALTKNAEAFVAKVRQFYAEHSSLIAESLRIDHDRCAMWCTTNGTMLCNLAKSGNWDQIAMLVKSFEGNVRPLAAMAMGESN
jgi:HK97 family phage portal protein